MTTVEHIALISAVAVTLAVPIVARLLRGRFDPFEPIVLFVLAYGVMFVTRPAAMVADHHLAYDGPRMSTDVSATFTKMLVLAFLGAVAFVAGYEMSLGRRLAGRWGEVGDLTARRGVVAALATGAVGVAAVVGFAAKSSGIATISLIFRGTTSTLAHDVEATSFYLWNSSFLLVPATLLLLAIGLEQRRKRLVALALAFGGLFLLTSVPLGTRSSLLPFLGGVFVFLYVRRAARPSLRTLVALAVVALVSSAFLSDLRGRETRNESVGQTVARSLHVGRIAAPLFSGPDSEMAPVLAAALGQIPSKLHYTYGGTIFGDLVTRPIPRALWDEKPVLPRRRLVTSLWPVESLRGGINPEFSILLYFFWDFGIPGVIAGMLVFGIAARALFEYFQGHRDTLAPQVLYSLALWFIVIGVRNSPVDTFIQFLFVVAPVWIAVRISARRRVPVVTAFSR